jgi:hypothetical protein
MIQQQQQQQTNLSERPDGTLEKQYSLQNKTDNILNKINTSCIEIFNDETTKDIVKPIKTKQA